MLDRVTITGADNSISPHELLPISRQHPWVEWGILASYNNTAIGCPRYPNFKWIAMLQGLAVETKALPNLSLHINGKWVRDLLIGNTSLFPFEFLNGFNRVQLNFHAEKTPCTPHLFAARLKEIRKEFIFQLDGASGNAHLDSANEHEVKNCHGLFDVSGGAGILPDKWPEPIYTDVHSNGEDNEEVWAYHGYAGGLGPENLAEQLPMILAAAAETRHTSEGRIWIDMETRVRSDNDRQFDLKKVRRCLEIASEYVLATERKAGG